MTSVNKRKNNLNIADITSTDIGIYLHDIETKTIVNKDGTTEIMPTSFSYRRTVYAALNSFFKYLTDTKIIDKNPITIIKRPKNMDEIQRRRLTKDELRKIVNSVDVGAHNTPLDKAFLLRDKAILTTFICTGMRESALSEINLEDLDFENDQLTVIDKRHKTHIYSIAPSFKAVLKEWINAREQVPTIKNKDALFISQRSGDRLQARNISDVVKKYSQIALGDGVSPHKLRAAFCTTLYEETKDIEFVRDAVGHSSVSVTQRYIVKDNSTRIKSANIMNSIIN